MQQRPLEILLYIGQRRGDFVKLGPKDIQDGMLCLQQQKTSQPVYIPLTSRFQEIIKDIPADAPSFITTAKGEPFTPAGFTNWFRDMCKEAGLPKGLSPHGVRKATCRRLAEAGCTPHQIMAISGHKSLSEVTRYTAAANRRDLALQAIATLTEH
ncbi:tyrosine-type recombinase/integrase [Falsigemmobacter faecalis]|uniref:Integrase n=1 Tax=Falsigemmobacter faecalis TaxID=2488730 RepID=A0A3P3DKN1_9RHOB|nr:integrase [Falsigemmobacter faecalis]